MQRSMLRLLPRIGLGDDDADGVLIKAFETAFALEVFQMAADDLRHKMLCRMGFGR